MYICATTQAQLVPSQINHGIFGQQISWSRVITNATYLTRKGETYNEKSYSQLINIKVGDIQTLCVYDICKIFASMRKANEQHTKQATKQQTTASKQQLLRASVALVLLLLTSARLDIESVSSVNRLQHLPEIWPHKMT